MSDDDGVWVKVWPEYVGVGNANFTDEPTGTYTENGVNYKYLTVTGTQSVNFDRVGLADVLIVGPGGGGPPAGAPGPATGPPMEVSPQVYTSLAVGESVIGSPSPLNVRKDT